jgi:hypothetical protein
MEMVFPATDCPAPDWWFDPLRDVLAQIGGSPRCAWLRLEDFVPRALVLGVRKDDVVQYRHVPSGRFLYLDMYGVAFRHVRPKDDSKGDGRLVETPLPRALEAFRPATFQPPPSVRSDGRPALRLIHGGAS